MQRLTTPVLFMTAIATVAPFAAHAADSCPAGYTAIEVADMEFVGGSCSAGWTSAGTIDWCGGDAGVCAMSPVWYVTFDYNSGTGSCASVEYGYGTERLEITCTPTRPGYKFDGWTTTKNGTTYVSAVGTTSGAYWQEDGFTLYAHWSICAASTTSGACGCPSGQAPNGSGGCATIQTSTPDSGSCPSGYIAVDMPDVEIAESCDTGWTSAGSINDCDSGDGVCYPMTKLCDAGYYLNNGECTICTKGSYCPGDNTKIQCPPDPENRGGDIITYYTDDEGNEFGTGAWLLSQCVQTYIPIEPAAVHGKVYKRCFFNETANKYNSGCHFGVASIMRNGGSCDAGYYWPGGNKSCFNEEGLCVSCAGCDCIPAGYGYWSPETDTQRTACDAGDTTRTETAVAASECVPLCKAGATEFHAGNLVFNLYENSVCTETALRVDLSGATCCVPLAQGNAADAVNIEHNSQTYHTTK